MIVVLAATGAWPAFVDQVFLSKRQYVDVGFSYAKAKRKQASRKAAAKSEEAIESRGRKARLETLETKAEALREQEQSLTAADEAKRLADAAAAAKAIRKDR